VSWWAGWFQIVFYILGLYAAVYIISYLFRTTAVIGFLLAIGGTILYIGSLLLGLYLLWQILTMMFTGSFLLGFLFLLLLGAFGSFVPMAVGMTLGYPLLFISEDIERRFPSVESPQPKKVEFTEIETGE